MLVLVLLGTDLLEQKDIPVLMFIQKQLEFVNWDWWSWFQLLLTFFITMEEIGIFLSCEQEDMQRHFQGSYSSYGNWWGLVVVHLCSWTQHLVAVWDENTSILIRHRLVVYWQSFVLLIEKVVILTFVFICLGNITNLTNLVGGK